ncbi:MAG TPA: 1-deoxy-D-xylulose-5-phosphate reductoisomerase [Smithellaceae bacterium]|nr:1-deoxy-D-xylulose-5-phosphate reductoisomerase [Smithellaceae bacterium]
MKTVSVLGSTGSIGVATLDVVLKNPKRFKIASLAAGKNIRLLASQIELFRPAMVSVATSKDAEALRSLVGRRRRTEILIGQEGACQVAASPNADIIVAAISGAAGLLPTLAAIEAGKDIALANKETMVMAGSIVRQRAKHKGVKILPVDSEHSAIFQCLNGQPKRLLKRIILTASGGPFLHYPLRDLKNVKLQQALKHPRWKMGRKITIDSATMMNKGLEVIEAKWLFDIDISSIDVLIHPESAVHSMVEFLDGSVIAQMGIPDMRIPIAYALSWPDRIENDLPGLDLAGMKQLTFFQPDMKKFESLQLAYEAGKSEGTAPSVLNAANEIAVSAFLDNTIRFTDISRIVSSVLKRHKPVKQPTLEEILQADCEARKKAADFITSMKKG